jgi:hypothetical protein
MKKILYIICSNITNFQKNIDNYSKVDADIKIINLSNSFFIHPKYNNIEVIHFPYKYIPSKIYNFCIISGFKNLLKPSYDIISIIKDNMILDHSVYNSHIQSIHSNNDFICDEIVSFTPKAIIKFGIFDEHYYSNLFIYDIIIRSIIYNVPSVINTHLFSSNPLNIDFTIKKPNLHHISNSEKDTLYFQYNWKGN